MSQLPHRHRARHSRRARRNTDSVGAPPPRVEAVGEPTREQILQWHRVLAACVERDQPGRQRPKLAELEAELHRTPRSGHRSLYLAYDGAEPVGTAAVRLFDPSDERHRADLELQVHPERRRRGIGTELMRQAAAGAAGEGRGTMSASCTEGEPSDGFLAAMGFQPVSAMNHLSLPFADLPDELLRQLLEQAPRGYRICTWTGTVPDDLAEALLQAKNAMGDVPAGKGAYGKPEEGTGVLVRLPERAARQGQTLRSAAALSERDGVIAGYTELTVSADGEQAAQHNTAVLPAHRGRGIGIWMKAALLDRLRRQCPTVTEVVTDNAAGNTPMLAINAELGFRTTARTLQRQADIEALVGSLSAAQHG